MKDYIIKRVNQNDIEYLVFGTSVESPLFFFNELSKNIKENKEVKVLFDQLLQTGNTDNRFLLMTFKDGSFEPNSAKKINPESIGKDIKEFATDFLKENPQILKYSILLNEQKEAIQNGEII